MIEPRSIFTAVIMAVILKGAETVIPPYCTNLSGAVTYVKQSTSEKRRKMPQSTFPVFVGSNQPSTAPVPLAGDQREPVHCSQ